MKNDDSNWHQSRKSLFSHADPSLAIKSMKSVNSHLHDTRNLLHSSLDRITNIKTGILNTSTHLNETSSVYSIYDERLKKSQININELKKK